ncbi:MAG: FtsX-like permease family protein [Candidatus Thorarchaeota archaeon]|nr:FtsX-like permease family protein [Candidatus Thorarchaeota archaeon]
MARKTRNTNPFSGNRAYPLSYAIGSIKSNSTRAFSLAFTLALGVALVASVFVWADTGVHVSVNGYFEENSFQLLIDNPPGGTEQVIAARKQVSNNPFVANTHTINSTIGLVSARSLPNDTLYARDDPLYSYGMKDCEVIFVTEEFMEESESQFKVDGTWKLKDGQTVVSTQFVKYYYDVFGITLSINSTIDVDLLQQRANGSRSPIGELGRLSIESLKVSGIYELKSSNSLIAEGFPSIHRSNYDHYHYNVPVLGIHDSMMILADSLNTSSYPEEGFFGARSFVRASANELISAGVESMANNLLTLKERIEERYDVNVAGLSQIMYLQNMVNRYLETIPLSLFNMPIFILALFVSVFAANTFTAARQREVSALRSKGASSRQIYGIFIVESVLMAIIGLFLGLIMSIFFAALIPSAQAFMVFNWIEYQFFLVNTIMQPRTMILSALICITPPLLFILWSARKAAQAEIGTSLVESTETIVSGGESYGFTIGASLVLLLLVSGAIILLPGNLFVFIIEIGFGAAAWFFIAYNGSRISRAGFARISSKASFILGEKSRISAGNLRMRKGRVIPLMAVLVLTLSSTIAFSVQASSFHTDLEDEIAYAVGSDLRVRCTSKPFNFTTTLETYPGVRNTIPVMRTWGGIGTEKITMIGIDAINYSLIANFDQSSFGGKDPNFVLSRLATIDNGIILSKYHAHRWNKTIGDSVNLEVGGSLASSSISFTLTGIVHSAPGFGYASVNDIPPSRLGASFGYQAGFSGFAITNLNFLSSETGINTANLFLGELLCVGDQGQVTRAIQDLPGVSATTPKSFDLYGFSFGTALFLSTMQGLLSIGFTMSFVLSIFALTLFLGSIVRERRKDYAILRALGSSRTQVVRIIVSEFAGIILASAVLSIILGTIFGYILSMLTFSMSPFSRVLPAVITFPIEFLTPVLLIEIIVMMFAAYLPAYEASKTDPAIVLRNL